MDTEYKEKRRIRKRKKLDEVKKEQNLRKIDQLKGSIEGLKDDIYDIRKQYKQVGNH